MGLVIHGLEGREARATEAAAAESSMLEASRAAGGIFIGPPPNDQPREEPTMAKATQGEMRHCEVVTGYYEDHMSWRRTLPRGAKVNLPVGVASERARAALVRILGPAEAGHGAESKEAPVKPTGPAEDTALDALSMDDLIGLAQRTGTFEDADDAYAAPLSQIRELALQQLKADAERDAELAKQARADAAKAKEAAAAKEAEQAKASASEAEQAAEAAEAAAKEAEKALEGLTVQQLTERAAEAGIEVVGTGTGGNILKRDLIQALLPAGE